MEIKKVTKTHWNGPFGNKPCSWIGRDCIIFLVFVHSTIKMQFLKRCLNFFLSLKRNAIKHFVTCTKTLRQSQFQFIYFTEYFNNFCLVFRKLVDFSPKMKKIYGNFTISERNTLFIFTIYKVFISNFELKKYKIHATFVCLFRY